MVVVAVHSLMALTVPGREGRVVARPADFVRLPGRAGVVLQDETVIVPADDDRVARAGYSRAVGTVRAFWGRVRDLPPGRADLLLAAVFLLECNLELSFVDASTAKVTAARGLTVAMACGVAARRRAPLVAAALIFGALIVLQQLGSSATSSIVGPFTSAFIVSYSIGANLEGRRLVVGIAWLVALVTVMALTDPASEQGLNVVWGWLVIVAAPVLAGKLLRDRARLTRALHAAAREDDAEPWTAQAVAEERERIATELHDVVTRALQRMVVDADGAGALVEAEPARAALAFAAVEQTGRDALAEIRRLLGVLRREDDELALAPQPTLAHVADLVRRARAAGLAVELRVEGSPVALSAGADLTAYRVVQEALAAAARERTVASAGVVVRYADAVVELEVIDDGPPRRAPLGIQERVALYGGELRIATPRAGGNLVRARLPLGSAA
jgi:signal transduction histidine kinase